jgi:Winged helix-turn helix
VSPIGRPKIVDDQYLERLRALVSQSPRDLGYPFQRWTASWLRRHLEPETGIVVSDRHINRLLKQMGLSTRPQESVLCNAQVENPYQAMEDRSIDRSIDRTIDRSFNEVAITIADLHPSTKPRVLLLSEIKSG